MAILTSNINNNETVVSELIDSFIWIWTPRGYEAISLEDVDFNLSVYEGNTQDLDVIDVDEF